MFDTMTSPAHIVIPAALMGLGVWMFGASHPVPRPLLTGPRRVRVHGLFGAPESSFPLAFDIEIDDVVAMFPEYRGHDLKARGWIGATRMILHRRGMAPEAFWVRERLPDLLTALGACPEDFIRVHLPSGRTHSKSVGDLEDGPSMELVPLCIRRSAIVQIGPSPVPHYQRRRMGRIYTQDGSAFDLYESLDSLRVLVGDGVLEIPNVEPLGRRR